MAFNYEVHTDVATIYDALELFKDFAQSEGWTIQFFNKACEWAFQNPGYAFDPGDEAYLELESNGYGSQTLNYRIRVENVNDDPLHEWVQANGFIATGNDTVSSTHPVARGLAGVQPWTFTNNAFTSFRRANIDRLWCVGDDKFLMFIVQCSANVIQTLQFGSIELNNNTNTELNYMPYNNTSKSAALKWYNENTTLGFDRTNNYILYDGDRATVRQSIVFTSGTTPSTNAFSYARLIVPNEYAGVRPRYRSDILIQRDSDSKFFDAGKSPVYRIDSSGYSIGQTEDVGGDTYLIFPGLTLAKSKGFALKVNP